MNKHKEELAKGISKQSRMGKIQRREMMQDAHICSGCYKVFVEGDRFIVDGCFRICMSCSLEPKGTP